MPKRLRPLSGLDAAFLYLEAAGTPMHVGSVMLLQPPPRRRHYDFHRTLIAHMRERLPQAPVLRRVLREAPLDLGHPMWSDGPMPDLDKHVQTRRLPAPGSLTQLWRQVADLHADPLPRDRPLWQFVVIEGLASGELVLYSKIHHALLDGQGGTALAQALLDVRPTQPRRGSSKSDARPAQATRKRDLAATALRASAQQLATLMRALPMTLKVAADAARGAGGLISRLRDSVTLAPRTPFNAQVGPQRSFAVASLPLDRVKHVARHFGASLNDVVLALCAATLRDYLLRRKALPDRPLIAAMPVSLRAAGNAEINNQVSMVQCALATDIADPVERLRAISAATGQLKREVASFRGLIPTDFPGFAAPIWASGLSRLWARTRIAERLPPLANVAISNVPGPAVPLYLAGAKVQHYFPVSIVTHGLGLNITVNSYAGWLEFGLIAGRDIAPKLDTLANGLARGLNVLMANSE
ncbi:MAG: wax ester/triacylglycerol synthase family O-acyltransferase [Rudaea sp.]|nr:wax ester/triacylglycerol synthase family O-acyltransferase [Rudaea sp.]